MSTADRRAPTTASTGAPRTSAARRRSPTGTARFVSCLAACGAALTVASCGNSIAVPSITGGPSEVDRVFLLAAGNWDRNRDGVVACDEWKAYAAELFDGADRGRSGALTKETWAGVTRIDKMFETVDFRYYDRNGDGKVDRGEMIERPSRAFELADRDKNCQLTTVELSGARTAGSAAPASAVGPPPDPSSQRRPGSGGGGGY